jgi:ribosomal protein S13
MFRTNRILSTTLDGKKPLLLALKGIYGVGLFRSRLILRELGLDENETLNSLSDETHRFLFQALETKSRQ